MPMASGVLRAVLRAHFVGEKTIEERRMQFLILSLQLTNSA